MTKHRSLPPIERLSELLEIVPIDPSQFGFQSGLIWRVSRGPQRAGNVAGAKKPHSLKPGRFDWQVKVDERSYLASRVIYFMANGVDPGELTVDHEDQNSLNNNVCNLRLGTELIQKHNRGTMATNTSGAVGVNWDRRARKWRAELTYKGEKFYLGVHTCKIDAARVVNDKIIELKLDKIGKPLNDLEAIECECCECQPNKRKRLFATSLAASLL